MDSTPSDDVGMGLIGRLFFDVVMVITGFLDVKSLVRLTMV